MTDPQSIEHRLVLDHVDVERSEVTYTLDGEPGVATANLATLTGGLPAVDNAAVELFLVAAAAWIADRSITRDEQPDRWTRTIDLSIAVLEPKSWPVVEVQRLLRFISNDRWTITLRKADRPTDLSPKQLPIVPLTADAVHLFSGGLDSYTYAAAHEHEHALFVGHWDMPVLLGLQKRLHKDLGRDRDRLRQFHVAVVEERTREKTSRTRGLLFAAAAIAVATSLEVPALTIPENGFVALNVPLTPSRSGALSTRSTHPHTLSLITAAANALGIPLTIDNPWLYSTKGEITRAAVESKAQRKRGTEMDGVAETVSCSHPNDRWRGDAFYKNCGYCYPCLVRRSGIEAANSGNDPTDYRFDPRTDATITDHGRQRSERRADIYAVTARLATPPEPRDLIRTAPLPTNVDPVRLQAMRERSHQELHAMLSNGMTTAVKRNLGLE